MIISHQLSTLEEYQAIVFSHSPVRGALIRYQARLDAIKGDQGRVSDDSMWSIKDLERQKECQTLVYELAKAQTKVTRYLSEDPSLETIEELSSEVDMLTDANRRIVDKYLKKESLYQDYLKSKSLLESDLKHILEVIFPDLTEEDRDLCLAELQTG
jgi:hypothetical protein